MRCVNKFCPMTYTPYSGVCKDCKYNKKDEMPEGLKTSEVKNLMNIFGMDTSDDKKE